VKYLKISYARTICRCCTSTPNRWRARNRNTQTEKGTQLNSPSNGRYL